MKLLFSLFFSLLVTLLVGSGLAAAQDNVMPPMPENFEATDFYFITVGRGDKVEARFGHTIVRMVDPSHGTDVGFNWGIFDFNDPGFAVKFYVGNLNYMLGIYSSSDLLQAYRVYEKRRYIQQRLNLTTAQKRALFLRFQENARPENIYYHYIHFRDNCSTRVRDHLDIALNGEIKRRFSQAPGAAHFRHYIRTSTDGSWWSYLGLDILSNSMLDRPISQWEEMFLPAMLKTRLEEMPALDDDGKIIPGLGLLGPQQILIDLPEPLPGTNPYFSFGAVFALLAVIGTWTAARTAARTPARGGQRWLGAAIAAYGLWSTLWGSLMAVNWLVSNHLELHHNASLWFFWPLDIVFVVAGFWMWIWPHATKPLPMKLQQLCRVVAAAHVAAAIILFALWSVNIVTQDVLPTLASFGPVALLLYGSWWLPRRGQ